MSCAATPKIGYIGDGDGSVGYIRQPSFGFEKLQDPTYINSSNLVGIWREMKKSRVQLDPILGLISGMIWVIAQKPKIK